MKNAKWLATFAFKTDLEQVKRIISHVIHVDNESFNCILSKSGTVYLMTFRKFTAEQHFLNSILIYLRSRVSRGLVTGF